jgi:hypothetical protein
MKPSSSPKPAEPIPSERLKSEMAAESKAEFYISPGVSDQAAIRAALQNEKAYRADEAPRVASEEVVHKNRPKSSQAA